MEECETAGVDVPGSVLAVVELEQRACGARAQVARLQQVHAAGVWAARVLREQVELAVCAAMSECVGCGGRIPAPLRPPHPQSTLAQ